MSEPWTAGASSDWRCAPAPTAWPCRRFLAACGRDEPAVTGPPAGNKAGTGGEERVIVGDVIDYALTSEEWAGAFGFVTFRLHRGVVDGTDVYLVRTDTSDEAFHMSEGLAWAHRHRPERAVVKWSDGETPVDGERTEYLGGGQLLEPVDTESATATFKLHECFPGVRYVVFDTSLEPMAEGMNVSHSPGLADSPDAGATGRTNVFMNGLDGSGPVGFQPSVFDSEAGNPEWSPYWDHMTYAWKDGAQPRVMATEQEVHAARMPGSSTSSRARPTRR